MISPETLRFFPIFARQDHYMLKEIAMLSKEIEVEAGEWIFQQDEMALWLYILLEGKVSLALILPKNGSGEHCEKMGYLCRGDILGWSSIVKPYLYSLGAVAVEDTKLIEIKAAGLRELMDDNPQFGYYLMKNVTEVISERLRYKCIQILSLKV